MCAITELAENSPEEHVTMNEIQTFAGHLGDKELMAKVTISLEEQGKLVAVKGAKVHTWQLSQQMQETAAIRLRLHFKHGPAEIGPDEFRTWKRPEPKLVQTDKGALG